MPRHIYVQKLEPSMTNLLRWMDREMTARLRSGAAVRKTGSLRSSVNALSTGENARDSQDVNKNKGSGQCYVCKASHYVDQCPRFQTMTPYERWEVVKEQKACFSCLKKGKGHTTANCLRKKECSVSGPITSSFIQKTPVLYKFLLCKTKAKHYFR